MMRDWAAMSDPLRNCAFSRRWTEPARPPPKRKRPALASNRPLIEAHNAAEHNRSAAPPPQGGPTLRPGPLLSAECVRAAARHLSWDLLWG